MGNRFSENEKQMFKNYAENSEDEIREGRHRRQFRKRRTLYVDDGGIGEIDYRFDNTKQMGVDSMDQERRHLRDNRLDRELEEREFQRMKRELQKSKDEFMTREQITRQNRNQSNCYQFFLILGLPKITLTRSLQIRFLHLIKKIFTEPRTLCSPKNR